MQQFLSNLSAPGLVLFNYPHTTCDLRHHCWSECPVEQCNLMCTLFLFVACDVHFHYCHVLFSAGKTTKRTANFNERHPCERPYGHHSGGNPVEHDTQVFGAIEEIGGDFRKRRRVGIVIFFKKAGTKEFVRFFVSLLFN